MATSPAPSSNVSAELTPVIGHPVVVSYWDGEHVSKSAVAHVLSIGFLDNSGASDAGHPSISLAFPSDPADLAKLGSARWQEGYTRSTGVVHYTHPDAVSGKASIVWGHPLEEGEELPSLLKAPANDAANPIFTREVLKEVAEGAQIRQTAAVQAGKTPTPTVISPLTSGVETPGVDSGAVDSQPVVPASTIEPAAPETPKEAAPTETPTEPEAAPSETPAPANDAAPAEKTE